MTRSTSLQRAVAALGALGLVLAAFMAVSTTGAAQAAPPSAAQAAPPSTGQAETPPQPPPTSLLFLSVTPRNGPVTTAVLFCDPPGGLHQEAVAACDDLATAQGDFTKLPGIPDRGCAAYYDPVVAAAFGWYRGRLVWFQRTYSNACEARSDTGPVFPHINPAFGSPPFPVPTPPTTVTTVPGPTPGPTTWDPPPTA